MGANNSTPKDKYQDNLTNQESSDDEEKIMAKKMMIREISKNKLIV